jgi:hypothetical protein
MSTIGDGDPMFTQADIEEGQYPFTKTVRAFLVGEKITNEGYTKKYHEAFFDERGQEGYEQRADADRKFITNKGKITPNMATNVANLLGYDVIELVRSDTVGKLVVRNRETDEQTTYETVA